MLGIDVGQQVAHAPEGVRDGVAARNLQRGGERGYAVAGHQVHQTNGGEGRSVAADLRVVAHHGLEQIAGVADHAVEHFLHGGLAAAVEPQHAVAVALDHEDAETAQRSVRLGEEGKVAAGEKVAQRLRTGEVAVDRSEEHTSELQSLMRNSYAVFCLKKKRDRLDTRTTQDDRASIAQDTVADSE